MIILLVMSLSCKIRAGAKKHSESTSNSISEKAAQFVFVSKIGAMVGGSSAVSSSQYISDSGFVQVSKEETNGVLHSLMSGSTDSSVFFENVAKAFETCPQMKGPHSAQENGTVTEYYSPTTYISYTFFRGNNEVCEYNGEVSNSDLVKKFINQVSDFVAETKLSPAAPGLYVRTNRNPAANLNLIAFDLELKRSDLPSFGKLKQMLANKMAMIRVREKKSRAKIANNLVIQAGNPVHLKIGKEAYLLFPYRYDPQK